MVARDLRDSAARSKLRGDRKHLEGLESHGLSGTAEAHVGSYGSIRIPRGTSRDRRIRHENVMETPLASRSDVPPTHTVDSVEPPPASDRPTSAMLKGDIDSGRTGDKNPVFDPALSPLGTDDEAAGTPPSSFRIMLARYSENMARWVQGSRQAGAAHHKWDEFPVVFVGSIGIIALVLIIGIWSVRGG